MTSQASPAKPQATVWTIAAALVLAATSCGASIEAGQESTTTTSETQVTPSTIAAPDQLPADLDQPDAGVLETPTVEVDDVERRVPDFDDPAVQDSEFEVLLVSSRDGEPFTGTLDGDALIDWDQASNTIRASTDNVVVVLRPPPSMPPFRQPGNSGRIRGYFFDSPLEANGAAHVVEISDELGTIVSTVWEFEPEAISVELGGFQLAQANAEPEVEYTPVSTSVDNTIELVIGESILVGDHLIYGEFSHLFTPSDDVEEDEFGSGYILKAWLISPAGE